MQNLEQIKSVSSEMQSYMDVVQLIQNAFPFYLEQKSRTYRQVISPPGVEIGSVLEKKQDVLITYSVNKKQPGSQKMPFQERTFTNPIYAKTEFAPGGIQQQTEHWYFVDVMVAFDVYGTNYSTYSLACEDVIEYMNILKMVPNEFLKRGFKVPTFWYQEGDEVMNIGQSVIYHGKLLYAVQLKQKLTNYENVIRSIEHFFELIER